MLAEILEIGTHIYIGGIGIRNQIGNPSDMSKINEVWDTFYTDNITTKLNSLDKNNIYGLYINYGRTPESKFVFIVGQEVEKPAYPEIWECKFRLMYRTIDPGKYAKITVTGSREQIVQSTWQDIWKLKVKRNYFSDFEVHHPNPSGKPEEQIIDFYIGLREEGVFR